MLFQNKTTRSEVAILILFFNKLEQTKDCINSFFPSGENIYVLNNGSDINHWKSLQSHFKKEKSISFLDAGKNLGVSGGRNFLINATKEPWIFCVDNDITIESSNSWLQEFVSFINNRQDAKIVCPLLYNVHDKTWSQQLAIKKKDNIVSVEIGEFNISNCFPGGASIVHRSVFDTYGLYDEEMFVGFEDYEFALRAITSEHKNLEAFHFNNITLIHDHRFQKSSIDKKAVRERYNEEKLKLSYDRMVQKYNIVFEHDWKWWTQKQVADMTQTKRLHQIKTSIKRLFGK